MDRFSDIAFTDRVKARQTTNGSRQAYENMAATHPAPEAVGPRETAFIEARDSFYLSTVSETGWPYVQHRGGPAGFLKVIGPTSLGFADYRGNRQFVSSGNLDSDDRVALILMDYPNRARLKVLGHARVVEAADHPDLAERLTIDGQGRVERIFTIEVAAMDWNCPQFITPRFTEAELQAAMANVAGRIDALEAENKALKDQLAALGADA